MTPSSRYVEPVVINTTEQRNSADSGSNNDISQNYWAGSGWYALDGAGNNGDSLTQLNTLLNTLFY